MLKLPNDQSIKAEGKEQSLNLRTQAYFELFYKYLCVRRLLGSFSIDDGDGIENVTIKMNSRFFKPFRFYILQIAENAKCGRIYPSWFLVVACLRPLLIVWQNEAWRAEKIFWGAPPASLISESGWPGPRSRSGSATETYCFYDVLVTVAVVVAKAPYLL